MIEDDKAQSLRIRMRVFLAATDKTRECFREAGFASAAVDRALQRDPYMTDSFYQQMIKFLSTKEADRLAGFGTGYGGYSQSETQHLIGTYRLYSPNSVQRDHIEVFGAKCLWNNEMDRAEFHVNMLDKKRKTIFILFSPKKDKIAFLNYSYHGWSSLCILRSLTSDVIFGVALKPDLVGLESAAWEPILFPFALKKTPERDPKPYEDLIKGSGTEYAEAEKLISAAFRNNASASVVWDHWRSKMPGNAGGGESNPVK
ncbi:MAG: hypothetical protein E5Y15_28560 [Mesorhizobium sp.]|nr:MAG: hypothetical protein E5Y15_28560 [Mesorhizobium sp.]